TIGGAARLCHHHQPSTAAPSAPARRSRRSTDVLPLCNDMVSLHLTSGCGRNKETARRMSEPPLERGEFKRGRGGRPTQKEAERRHRTLLKTAMRLFMRGGWEGTSIDEISRQSKVAKRFIYARYPDKAALFVGTLQRFID